MIEQNVEREGVLVEVAAEDELAVDVACLSRLKNRRVSFLVQNCKLDEKHTNFEVSKSHLSSYCNTVLV